MDNSNNEILDKVFGPGANLSIGVDWTGVRKEMDGYLSAIKQTPRGAGVDIFLAPSGPGTSPKQQEKARIQRVAIGMFLATHNGLYEANDHGDSITIMRKGDMMASMGKDIYQQAVGTMAILTADNLRDYGYLADGDLPSHKLRDGADWDKFNGTTQGVKTDVTIFGADGEPISKQEG